MLPRKVPCGCGTWFCRSSWASPTGKVSSSKARRIRRGGSGYLVGNSHRLRDGKMMFQSSSPIHNPQQRGHAWWCLMTGAELFQRSGKLQNMNFMARWSLVTGYAVLGAKVWPAATTNYIWRKELYIQNHRNLANLVLFESSQSCTLGHILRDSARHKRSSSMSDTTVARRPWAWFFRKMTYSHAQTCLEYLNKQIYIILYIYILYLFVYLCRICLH